MLLLLATAAAGGVLAAAAAAGAFEFVCPLGPLQQLVLELLPLPLLAPPHGLLLVRRMCEPEISTSDAGRAALDFNNSIGTVRNPLTRILLR